MGYMGDSVSTSANGYIVKASNKLGAEEHTQASEESARITARLLSKEYPGIAYSVYEVGDGAEIIATYLNGEVKFTAA